MKTVKDKNAEFMKLALKLAKRVEGMTSPTGRGSPTYAPRYRPTLS